MAKFYFCLTTGVDGFLPDDQVYVAADSAVDAYDAIKAAIRDFLEFHDEADHGDKEPREASDWKQLFERGCRYPDASMWNFTLAYGDPCNLSLVGMTEAEYYRESQG